MATRLLAVILILGLLFGALFGVKYWRSQGAANQGAMQQPPATVAAVTVEKSHWQPYLEAVGSLVATREVFVSLEIAGQVSEILFESGASVAAGELLLQLDDSVDQAELKGLLADRRLAQLEFARAEKLLTDKLASQSNYDQAQARLQSASALLDAKRALVAKKAIRAPFSGVLGIRQVNIGQYLEPGAQIVSLQQLDPVYVDYALPERHISMISLEQAVRIKVKAFPAEQFAGRISAIDPRVDRNTRSARIRATLANPQLQLRPGMFAEVQTLLPERDNVLTVPQTAITYNPYGDAVFVVMEKDEGLVVERRQVQTGSVRDGRVEVTEGLSAGERVVSAGQLKLRNDQRVVLDDTARLGNRAVAP
ncbi:MAG: efflux RND transporter periplasmic adaptor subunit [Gammaproteobacteria bacterium]|nr:efflux RND transporter periplasmic adaptor subunit [Gammaproteobacteria bacterium]